jgi:hypothetical protein
VQLDVRHHPHGKGLVVEARPYVQGLIKLGKVALGITKFASKDKKAGD